jgi:hypothetical protein
MHEQVRRWCLHDALRVVSKGDDLVLEGRLERQARVARVVQHVRTKPNELYWIGEKFHCCNWSGYTQAGDFTLFSYEAYRRFKENTPGFSELTAFQADPVPLGVRRSGSTLAAEPRNREYVSGISSVPLALDRGLAGR